jgi:hypothetical protein
VYQDREDRIDPTRFDDYNLPHHETVAVRLHLVDVGSGSASILGENPGGLRWFQVDTADHAGWVLWGDGAQPVHLRDLDTGASLDLSDAGTVWPLAPDGRMIAYSSLGELKGMTAPLVLQDLHNGHQAVTGSDNIDALFWLANGDLLGHERGSRLIELDREAKPVKSWPCAGTDRFHAAILSPDERQVLLATELGTGILPLDACKPLVVSKTHPEGWLNASEVLESLADGIYALPVGTTFHLPSPSPPTAPSPSASLVPQPGSNLVFGKVSPSSSP